MGAELVIVWRDADGHVRAFVNRCVSSDEPLTLAPRGRAGTLRCPCHGWDYGAEARQGRPPLDGIAHVVSYRGLIFANRDPDAPVFDAWLGDFAWYLDLFLPAGGAEIQGGDALRWTIEANWKLSVLAGCGDLLIGSAATADSAGDDGVQISLAGGAVALHHRADVSGDDPRAGFSPLGAALFPNLLFDRDRHSLEVVHPIGPARCEVHSYCLVDAGAPDAVRDAARRRFQFLSGPAGVRSGHQARLWQSVTAVARSGRHRDQLLSVRMGMGKERRSNVPGSVAPLISEANQRAFLRRWQGQLAIPARTAPRLMRFR